MGIGGLRWPDSFSKSPGMRGDYGGTDLLENADFPPRKAKSADEGGVRLTQFQGAESHERGNRIILPFCAHKTPLLRWCADARLGST